MTRAISVDTSTNAGSIGTFNVFVGGGGNDTITGNGNTQVQYFNATSGVLITLGANGSGSASGDSSVGSDTFVAGVDNVLGSNFNDTYNASAFTSSSGPFNQFQGLGGNDTITGNGSTQLYYAGSTAGISVTLNAGGAGTVTGDSSVGTDTINGGSIAFRAPISTILTMPARLPVRVVHSISSWEMVATIPLPATAALSSTMATPHQEYRPH